MQEAKITVIYAERFRFCLTLEAIFDIAPSYREHRVTFSYLNATLRSPPGSYLGTQLKSLVLTGLRLKTLACSNSEACLRPFWKTKTTQ